LGSLLWAEYCVDSKPKFVFHSGGKSFRLRIIERGKGYLWSICLGREGGLWLLTMMEEVVGLDNNVGFVRKVRDSYSAVLCQKSCNSHGAYLVIEEFSGGAQMGVILLPEGRVLWGWCCFDKVLRLLLKPYITVTQFPPEVALSAPAQCVVPVDRSYAKAVVSSNFHVNSMRGEDKLVSSFSSIFT
jgi:hypothetical protein